MKIVQANVWRGGPAHDLLLSFEADIVLVQEFWTACKTSDQVQSRYKGRYIVVGSLHVAFIRERSG